MGGVGIIGVHLQAEFVAGINNLEQQGESVALWCQGAGELCSAAPRQFIQRAPVEGTSHDPAHAIRMGGDLPGLSARFRCAFAFELTGDLVSTPEIVFVDRGEYQWLFQ